MLPQPLLSLSVYFERNRTGYDDLLLQTSRTGDLNPWISPFLRAISAQTTDAEERTVRLVGTAQSAIDHLVDRGDLIETTGRKRNRFYFAQGIFDTVYGTTEKPSEEQSTLFEAQ